MENFLFSLNVTLPIFIIIVVGGFLQRIGLLNEGFTSVADKFVFKVALPVQLFRDIATMDIRSGLLRQIRGFLHDRHHLHVCLLLAHRSALSEG